MLVQENNIKLKINIIFMIRRWSLKMEMINPRIDATLAIIDSQIV